MSHTEYIFINKQYIIHHKEYIIQNAEYKLQFTKILEKQFEECKYKYYKDYKNIENKLRNK